MLNNYYKVILPLIIRDYYNEKSKYKYKGNAYILFEKRTNNVAFNTLILDSNQKIIGADGGRYGEGYCIRKKPDAFKVRKEAFSNLTKKGKKIPTELKIPIDFLNKTILKNKLTIKEVDAFITGSNSSGGLKKPKNDPVRIFYDQNDLIYERYKGNLKKEKIEWKFFSLLSNMSGNFQNAKFPDEITLEYLNKIEEKTIDDLFELKDWKFIPYNEASYDDLHIPFKEAFASQNFEIFINPSLAKAGVIAQSEENWRDTDYVKYILECVEIGDKRFLSKQIRATWRRIIDKDIEEKNYQKDFVRGISSFQKAHIFENHEAVNKLLLNDEDIDVKKEYLKDLFNKNNYILLTNEIHSLWDGKRIYIDYNGNIKNINLTEEEFSTITRDHDNIYSIYENILNDERSYLFNKRKEQIN